MSSRNESIRTWVWRGVVMAVGAVVLYVLLPQILDLWGQFPELRSIGVTALVALAVGQIASWWSAAELDRSVLPGLTRSTALMTALTANAVSRVVPAAGGGIGIGLSYRMWAVSGVQPGAAASAVAARTVISLTTLFALPVVTVALAVVGAPTPHSLLWVALGGAAAFVLLFGLGALLLFTDGLLDVAGRLAEVISRRFGRDLTPARMREQRDELRGILGAHWPKALASSVGNWGFDYLSLVAVLVALGARPHLSVVLLAFTASKILGMVPITPGGIGIVEAGLTGMLTLAGIPATDALLATLAYRIASYWLTLPIGLAAWLLFRHRHPAVRAH